MLTSARNPKVAAAVRLKKRALREQERRFLVEGAQGVAEALAEERALESLFVLDELDPLAVRARQAGVPVEPVSPRVMERLTSTVTPQGIVGVAPFVDVGLDRLTGPGCVAVLHEVRDPGNAGTILRSSDAAGAIGVVFAGSTVDPYNAKTVRASAGSIFHVPVVRGVPTEDAIGALRERGFGIVAMDMHGEDDLFEAALPEATAFVFGNEAHGLPDEVAASADRRVRVPQMGRAESLNLSAAAAHDIRSPLTAMKGFGYALSKRWEAMDEAQRDLMLVGIVHDADRMDTILRQLVDAARIRSGGFEAFRELTDVADVVEQVAEQQARDPDHPLIRWAGGAVSGVLDGVRLKTTVLAFVEALVWWGSDGDVEVRASTEDGRLRLVASRSAASGPDDLESLFEARAPGTGGGSKIGLYVARRVAEAQGGRAWGEHAEGRLSFHLELPLAGGAVPAP